MKLTRTLLLGSAAGLVAVGGARAADLPVKAKPVEYVRVCSLYGAGFWYVPGTDTCLKIGSYVRVQTSWNTDSSDVPIGAGGGQPGGRETRTDTSNFGFRTRAMVSVDLRTQTDYGTLRSYMDVGAQWSTGASNTAGNNSATATSLVSGAPNGGADTLWVDRGFIQFAGFTAGRVRSYFDINSLAPYTYSNNRINPDTGALGIYALAYTAQFGNGITASLAFEDNGQASGGRGHLTTNLAFVQVATASTGEWSLGNTSFDNKGQQAPDVVGELRIDQAWGYAEVSAALHDASGGYYGTSNLTVNGHPSDKYGWAVSGGFTLNDILGFKGDQFGLQLAYSQGAAGYVTRATGAWQMYSSGNNAGFGWITDGVYDTGTAVELTTVWGISGFAQHFWSPRWRTSVYGGYVEVDYDGAATAMINAHLPAGMGCSPPGGTVPNITGFTGGQGAGTNSCSPNFSFWQAGTRTQWNPHPDLDVGVDVLWTHLNTAYKGTATLPANGARPAGVYAVDDQDILSVMFRIQRNFLP
jgi:hypothetical protein